MRRGSWCGLAIATWLGLQTFAQPAPELRSAAGFVVLGETSVTNTGTTRITGNVGVSPGNTVTGLPSSAFVLGDIRRDDALARAARKDSDAIYDGLANPPCTVLPDSNLAYRDDAQR